MPRRNSTRPPAPPARSRLFGAPSAETGHADPRRTRLWFVVLLLALAVLPILVYAPVRHFDFVSIDDHVYVSNNPFIRSGLTWARVPEVFVSTHGNFWHPLTILSLMLDVAVFGAAPGPLHLTNLVLHVACTWLLFLVLHRTTRSVAPSAFVAALFAVHPLHVESVAWISQRKDVLSTVFWMLTLLSYARLARAPRWPPYLLALACFALGLMAKPMLVTLPLVMLLLDVWPLRRVSLCRDPARPGGWPILSRAWIPLIIEKLPFVGLSVAVSILAVVAQQGGKAVATLEGFTLAGRLANAPIACVTYIAKMLWPSALTVFYPYAQTPDVAAAAASTAALLVVSVLVVRAAPARPYFMVGWFWYLCTLLPVSGLVQVGSHAMADRYTYVPLVGLFVALTWGIADMVRIGRPAATAAPGDSAASARMNRGARLTLAVLGSGVVVVLSLLARTQVMTWKDSVALWQHAVDVMPDNYYAHNAYGLELQKQGRNAEAAAHFLKASALAPGFPNADSNLALLLADDGRTAEAITHYEEALRRAPDYQPAHANLGIVLVETGRPDEAIAHYQEALRIDPSAAPTHYNLGNALQQMGRLEAAVEHYREALRLDSSYTDVHQSLGRALGQLGRTDEAVLELQTAVRLAENPASPLVDLGNALLGAGRTADALLQFRSAVSAAPNSAEAHMGLGTALFRSGRVSEAAEEHALAVRLAPGLANAHYNLAVTLATLNRLREAAVEFERTLQLEGDSADVNLELGMLLERLGQRNDASTHYSKALQAQPDLAAAREGLARVSR